MKSGMTIEEYREYISEILGVDTYIYYLQNAGGAAYYRTYPKMPTDKSWDIIY